MKTKHYYLLILLVLALELFANKYTYTEKHYKLKAHPIFKVEKVFQYEIKYVDMDSLPQMKGYSKDSTEWIELDSIICTKIKADTLDCKADKLLAL